MTRGGKHSKKKPKQNKTAEFWNPTDINYLEGTSNVVIDTLFAGLRAFFHDMIGKLQFKNHKSTVYIGLRKNM